MHAFQKARILRQVTMCSMLSMSFLHILHVWSVPGCLFLTLSARWTSLRHCLSSVASDRSVPKDLKIVLNLMMCGKCSRHALTQFGNFGLRSLCVRKLVTLWTVRSDSLRGLPACVGSRKSGCHPIFRGYATVMGPIIASGLQWTRSHISCVCSLPYSGLGIVGVSSHISTGMMSSWRAGVIMRPVGCP